MPSQRMPLRKDPTSGGKGVKLPEKKSSSLSHLSSLAGVSSPHCPKMWGCSWQKRQQCKKEASPAGWEGKGKAARSMVVVWAGILNGLH